MELGTGAVRGGCGLVGLPPFARLLAKELKLARSVGCWQRVLLALLTRLLSELYIGAFRNGRSLGHSYGTLGRNIGQVGP